MRSSPPKRTLPADPTLEPTSTAYATMPQDAPRSSCLADTVDVGLLLVLPCEPMARTMSSVRFSYVAVFLTVAIIYGGGIACLGAAAAVDHPLFDWAVGYAVLAGWILNVVGTLPSAVCVAFGWAFASADYDDDPDTTNDVSGKSMALVALFVCCQVVFLGIVMYMRHELRERSHASSCCASSLGSCCFTLWLPSCSFAEAMQRARSAQDQQQIPVADVLPAYNMP